jgi:hypothetical protein
LRRELYRKLNGSELDRHIRKHGCTPLGWSGLGNWVSTNGRLIRGIRPTRAGLSDHVDNQHRWTRTGWGKGEFLTE